MVASVIWILLAIFLYGLFHSFLASLGVKAYVRRLFGEFAERTYRLFYNFLAVVTLLPVLALTVVLPDRVLYTVPFPWMLFFVGGQVLAVVALFIGLWHTGVWGFLGLQQLVQPAQSSDATAQLVVRGLYRWVRHPLYTAGLVFIWLLPVMTVNLLAFNLGLTAYIVIGAMVEERKLLREFGEAYAAYQQSTPMLVPNPFVIRRGKENTG